MELEISKIWSDFHQELKSFILNKTRNASDTDDILQEVFMKIIKNFDKVSKSENLRHYIYGIVRNSVNDYFRSKRPLIDYREVKESLNEEESISLNETVAECCIRPFINKLPQDYRDALLASEFQEISQKELAMKLGISYSGAKSRVQRGKEKLKNMILDCCAYESDKYGNLIDGVKKNCNCP